MKEGRAGMLNSFWGFLVLFCVFDAVACYAMLVVGTDRTSEEQWREDEEQWRIINSPAYRARKRSSTRAKSNMRT